ncbi:hypothetical protein GCM10010246_16330 [Streptomyces cuspidosporus]|uniref:Molecular chaperone DnaJ n=1 Tax=Streptomyces cuspidosporus TaxID=66882 RepID=A0ABN3FM84_9ACTN
MDADGGVWLLRRRRRADRGQLGGRGHPSDLADLRFLQRKREQVMDPRPLMNAPIRCTTCNGTGEGQWVITGNGSKTRQPCGSCGGTGQK